jgi:pimeloyl-ACP methyl ester carboxylesterase
VEALYDLQKFRYSLEEKHLRAGDHTWSYLDGGSGKETILFVHGFSSDKESWMRVAGPLTDSYRVIIPDLPGFGETPMVKEKDYTIRSQVERLAIFMKELGIDRHHIMGVSMGGWIAGRYAIDYNERVMSLGLMDTAGLPSPEPAEYRVHLMKTGQNILIPRTREELEVMLSWVFVEPPMIPGPILDYTLEKRLSRIDREKRLFQAILDSDQDYLVNRLDDIRTRTLVLWGEKDRIIDPSTVEVLKTVLENGEYVIFPETGHAPLHERDRAVVSVYRDFLRRWDMTTEKVEVKR